MIGRVTDPADLGVVEAAEALHARDALLARARRGVPRPHPRARRRPQPRRRPRLDQRLGTRLRGGRARCGCDRRRAARRRRCTEALRYPDRAEGPLRRRRQAADGVERRARRSARARLRRVGAAFRRRDGAARPSAHARVRLRRHDRPGRQSVGARALGRRLERRLGGRARVPSGRPRRPAPTRPARCASPRPSAGRRRSSRRAGSSRCAASSRSRRRSTTPGRWPAPCATASRCSRRSPVSTHRASGGALRRYALSPRIAELDPDVADGFERALAALPGERVEPPPPAARLDVARRVLRPRAHGDAPVPPPLRRTAGTSTASRTAPGSSTPSSGR